MQILQQLSSAKLQNDDMTESGYRAVMQNDSAVAYIQAVIDEKGWTPTELAKRAGVSASTITRPLKSPDWETKISRTTLEKIQKASGITPPFFAGAASAPPSDAFRMPAELILEKVQADTSDDAQGHPEAVVLSASFVGLGETAIVMSPEQASFLKDEILAALSERRVRVRDVM